MHRRIICGQIAIAAQLVACGGDSSGDTGGSAGSSETTSATQTTSATMTTSMDGGSSSGGTSRGDSSSTGAEATTIDGSTTAVDTTTGGTGEAPTCDELPGVLADYRDSHSGNGGMDWDINLLTPAEIAADPVAQSLFALCGTDERPVIPLLAWEHGGADHQWINPEESALFYCVYTPVDPSTKHWDYDDVADHVTADVTIGCPEQNPCNAEMGADQVLACDGDITNLEIIVDIASYNDGADAGLSLSEASTDLYLLLDSGERFLLYQDI